MEHYGPDKIDPYKLDDFTRSYIETAIWASDDWDKMVGNNPTPMEKDHGIEDYAHSTLSKLVFIAQTWIRHMGETIEEAGIEDDKAGQCLWLDQNGHGAGFGDEFHVPEEIRDKLRQAAKQVKEINLYIGEDGKIHA